MRLSLLFLLFIAALSASCESALHRAYREQDEEIAAIEQDRREDRRPQPKLDKNRHWPRDRDVWMLDLAP